eukprot:6985832-Alexandrium_andersonii.AAC.1
MHTLHSSLIVCLEPHKDSALPRDGFGPRRRRAKLGTPVPRPCFQGHKPCLSLDAEARTLHIAEGNISDLMCNAALPPEADSETQSHHKVAAIEATNRVGAAKGALLDRCIGLPDAPANCKPQCVGEHSLSKPGASDHTHIARPV